MSSTPQGQPVTIDQAHLRRVRNLARESGRTVLAELEHLNNGTPEALVQQLALMFGMTAIDLTGLLGMTPAFDLLPLALAQQWHCMLLRDADGILSGVLADPFDPDLQLWLNNQDTARSSCALLPAANCAPAWRPGHRTGAMLMHRHRLRAGRSPAEQCRMSAGRPA